MLTGRRVAGAFQLLFASILLLAAAPPSKAQVGYNFVPVTPCRIADTRGATGPLGGPTPAGGSTRSFLIPGPSCGPLNGRSLFAQRNSNSPANSWLPHDMAHGSATAHRLHAQLYRWADQGKRSDRSGRGRRSGQRVRNRLDRRNSGYQRLFPAARYRTIRAGFLSRASLSIGGYALGSRRSRRTHDERGANAFLPGPFGRLQHSLHSAGLFAELYGGSAGSIGVPGGMARGTSTAYCVDLERADRRSNRQCRYRPGGLGRID